MGDGLVGRGRGYHVRGATRPQADPVRLHVGLSEDEPDLYAIPDGGGIGYWVESHATISRAVGLPL